MNKFLWMRILCFISISLFNKFILIVFCLTFQEFINGLELRIKTFKLFDAICHQNRHLLLNCYRNKGFTLEYLRVSNPRGYKSFVTIHHKLLTALRTKNAIQYLFNCAVLSYLPNVSGLPVFVVIVRIVGEKDFSFPKLIEWIFFCHINRSVTTLW